MSPSFDSGQPEPASRRYSSYPHVREFFMIKNPRVRRTVSMILLLLGGVFIFLAPQNAWVGMVLMGMGLAMEVISYVIRRNRNSDVK